MDLDNITLMKDFVREKGGVFVHPGGIDAKDTIFQVDENDMITETAVDGLYGYKTRVMNHRFWVGTIRHAIGIVQVKLNQTFYVLKISFSCRTNSCCHQSISVFHLTHPPQAFGTNWSIYGQST